MPLAMPRRLIFAMSLACALAAQASERVALVIGNSDYKNSPLINPRNDANAMAELLAKAGFAVDKQLDTDLPRMQSAVDRFGAAIRDPKVKFGLFYYAGHGLQQDWRNYIVPVSARIRNASDVTQQTVDVSGLLRYMDQATGRSFLVVLDACRDDPFAGAFRPAAKGLTQFDAPVGSLLAYATAPGSVAQDGEGANGLYTGFLLREFAVPGARLEDAFKRVRLSVRMASKGTQVPWESTSLEENIYLFPTVTRNLTEADQDELLEKEMTAWLKVKSSSDPEALAAYIREFPSGSASELAQSRLSRMLSVYSAQETQRRQAAALASSKAAQELAAREEEARQRVAQAEETRLASERAEAERVRLAQLDAAREEAQRQQLAQEIAQREQAVRLEQERARAAELEAARVAQAQQEAARQLEQQAQAAARELQRVQALQAQKEAQERALALQAEQQARVAQAQQREAERLAAAQKDEANRQAQRLLMAKAEEERLAAQNAEIARLHLAQQEAAQAEARRLQAAQESAARAQAARLAAEKAQLAQQEAQKVAAAREEAQRQNQLQAQLAQAQLQRLQALQAEKEASERALALQAEQARVEQTRLAQVQQQEAARLAAEKQSLLAAAALPSAPKMLAATPNFKGYAEHQRSYRTGDVFTINVIDAFTKIGKPLVMKVTQVDVQAERVVYNDGEFVSDLMGNTTTNQRGSFSTPRQFYPAELIVGYKWHSRFKQTRPNGVVYTFQYDLKVVGKETITVPAGTFDAYKIEARGFNMELGARLERNIWVSPGINADIAHEIKVRLSNGRWDQNDRQELVSIVKGNG
jgi:hypothetical protein